MVVEITVSNDITLLLSWYTNDSQISGLNDRKTPETGSAVRAQTNGQTNRQTDATLA